MNYKTTTYVSKNSFFLLKYERYKNKAHILTFLE